MDSKKVLDDEFFVFCGTPDADQEGPVITRRIEPLLSLGSSHCIFILRVQSACRPSIVRVSFLANIAHADRLVPSGAFA